MNKQTYCVFNQTGESFVGLSILRADTPLSRLRGLFGQLRMKAGEGLWLVPSSGVQRVGSLTPVDLIYLDSQNRVVWLVEHLSPLQTLPFRKKGASVLILPPHTIYSSHTHLGDQLLICLPEDVDAHMKKNASRISNTPLAEEA